LLNIGCRGVTNLGRRTGAVGYHISLAWFDAALMLVSVAVFDVAPVSLLALVSTTEAAVLCWTLEIPKLVLLFSDSKNTGIVCRDDHPLLQGY
jgi:hypothetical protein